jgi:hypothetical protein
MQPQNGGVYCRPVAANIVRLPSQNVATLQAQINGLQAGGNTSITLGMKWGLALLDPGARGMYSELIAANQIPTTLAGRPFDYTDPEAIKAIVLMTDGEHVSHDRITDAYKTGTSPIYRSSGDGQYSIYHAAVAGSKKYWVPHLGTWQTSPWNSGGGVAQQNWQDVWSKLKLSYVAWQFYGRALGTTAATRTATYNTTMNSMRAVYASVSSMNAQLQQSCGLAKDNDIILYGIAFEAPANGQTQISNCVTPKGSDTADGFYFDAQGKDEIRRAFRQIASNLSQLKLTQ